MGNDCTAVTVTGEVAPGASLSRDACLVVINGIDLGKKYCLTQASTLVGRSSEADIQIDEDAISRRHAVIEGHGDRFVIRDLDSTNGTYVNDRVVHEHSLGDGDQIKIGRTILKFLTDSNIEASYHEEIYRLTTIDGLTQVYNKFYFLKEMARAVGRSVRYGHDLSLILCDIDYFKLINDSYGHLAGDHVLKQVAQHIQRHTHPDDVFARYGGEEFVTLLPKRSKHTAVVVAETLRKLVDSELFEFDGTTIPVTLSMGVADLREARRALSERGGTSEHDSSCFALIKLADDRLYWAKQIGRNTIVAEGWQPAPRSRLSSRP
ncbi:MAG: GGDEF domain-containing protein [Nitrococcus mobilis]|nr:GGDEF domain-containing protein [Nitrococcus mobilis]